MSFANPAPHNYVITTATLTITASAQNKTYGPDHIFWKREHGIYQHWAAER